MKEELFEELATSVRQGSRILKESEAVLDVVRPRRKRSHQAPAG